MCGSAIHSSIAICEIHIKHTLDWELSVQGHLPPPNLHGHSHTSPSHFVAISINFIYVGVTNHSQVDQIDFVNNEQVEDKTEEKPSLYKETPSKLMDTPKRSGELYQQYIIRSMHSSTIVCFQI